MRSGVSAWCSIGSRLQALLGRQMGSCVMPEAWAWVQRDMHPILFEIPSHHLHDHLDC